MVAKVGKALRGKGKSSEPLDPALAILFVTIFSSDVAIFSAFLMVGIISPSLIHVMK